MCAGKNLIRSTQRSCGRTPRFTDRFSCAVLRRAAWTAAASNDNLAPCQQDEDKSVCMRGLTTQCRPLCTFPAPPASKQRSAYSARQRMQTTPKRAPSLNTTDYGQTNHHSLVPVRTSGLLSRRRQIENRLAAGFRLTEECNETAAKALNCKTQNCRPAQVLCAHARV